MQFINTKMYANYLQLFVSSTYENQIYFFLFFSFLNILSSESRKLKMYSVLSFGNTKQFGIRTNFFLFIFLELFFFFESKHSHKQKKSWFNFFFTFQIQTFLNMIKIKKWREFNSSPCPEHHCNLHFVYIVYD